MWKTAVFLIYVVLVIVTTAPVYRHGRGLTYTLSNTPEHRKPFLEVRNLTYHGSGPREEARAMCSVKTQEINATANATITRRLHGVVTSTRETTVSQSEFPYNFTGELHSSIQRLEVIIFGQMQQLWQSLDSLRAQLSGDAQTNFPNRHTMTFRYRPGVK